MERDRLHDTEMEINAERDIETESDLPDDMLCTGEKWFSLPEQTS